MKKIALLLNMIVASVNVFGMNVPYREGINSIKKHSFHVISGEDSAILKKKGIRHLGIFTKRYFSLSKRIQFMQNNSLKTMNVEPLRPVDVERILDRYLALNDELKNEEQLRDDSQLRIDELKRELDRLTNLNVEEIIKKLEGEVEEAHEEIDIIEYQTKAKQIVIQDKTRELKEAINSIGLGALNYGIGGINNIFVNFNN